MPIGTSNQAFRHSAQRADCETIQRDRLFEQDALEI
jgi:hypothetical protein